MRGVVAILTWAAILLSGCAGQKTTSRFKGPHLVSLSDSRSAKLGAAGDNGNTLGQIEDRLSSMPQDVYIPNKVTFLDCVVNQGLPSTGIKLAIKGDAITQGYIGAPDSVGLTADADAKSGVTASEQELSVSGNRSSGFVAEAPDFKYGSQFKVSFTGPTLKGGLGNVEIFVYPLDSRGETSCVLRRSFNVLSDGSEQIQE